jgi:hypothetical protein
VQPTTAGSHHQEPRRNQRLVQQLAMTYLDDVVTALKDMRVRHWKQKGDYRTGYGEHCSVCSVTKSEPYYNESRSWRVAEDWPCDMSKRLDNLLASLVVERVKGDERGDAQGTDETTQDVGEHGSPC